MLIAVVRGPAHVIELANPPMCEAWGCDEREIRNRPLFEVLPELDDQVLPMALDAVYRTGTKSEATEIPAPVRRADGTTEIRYFNYTYAPFRNDEGAVDGIFIIASDVTTQVLALGQLNVLRRAAEDANRAKDEFLAMLGHELRNPLSPILTALQLMRLQDDTRAERARTVIERQVTHLTRLVDDLLDVSRIARGKVELKSELLEMADIVAKAVEMASPLLEQRSHNLILDVPRHGLMVYGDSTRLRQIVSNLLTNAAKYTPAGGEIRVAAREEDGNVVLCVRDNGIGIAPDVMPTIFDLFVQERQAIDRAQGGLGLGLTIVRNLVERHGGSIAVKSLGVGQGSEFLVRLPLATQVDADQDRRERITSAVEFAAPRAHVGRVLIVDDNEDAAEMLALALQHKGFETRVANDAPAALRIAAEFVPDIAVLDIGLPVIDGYELASHLRSLPGLDRLHLIAVTGYGQESDRQRAREAGFHHHLVKPVAIEAIEAAVMSRD